MNPPPTLSQADGRQPTLPTEDPILLEPGLNLDRLADHWANLASRRAMTAEQMRGADARAQRLGVAGSFLMEQAGAAVAAAARAMLAQLQRPASGLVLVLAGPGNNGGDAFVAARHLATAGIRSVVVLASSAEQPDTPDAARNWDLLEGIAEVERVHAADAHDVALFMSGLERAALVIDGLLGTGVRGALREPVRTAVDLCLRARRLGVPVLAIDAPTALDLTSGAVSDPVVVADVTVTFHRPKEGLTTRNGRRLAGRVLVAPIGIPSAADPT